MRKARAAWQTTVSKLIALPPRSLPGGVDIDLQREALGPDTGPDVQNRRAPTSYKGHRNSFADGFAFTALCWRP